MIDRHYDQLARDGSEHAIRLLDGYADTRKPSDGLEPSTPTMRSTSTFSSAPRQAVRQVVHAVAFR